METVDFVVEGEPRPWQVFTKQGKPTPGWEAMKGWQELIWIAAREAMKGRAPFTGRIHLKILFCRGFPDRAPKAIVSRTRWVKEHILTKPDLTNVLKSCEDALSNIVYLDDNQVVRSTVEKEYGEAAHTWIVVQAPDG